MSEILTIISTGSVYCNSIYLTELELNERKSKLQKDALQFLSEYPDASNIVYAHDDLDDGNIVKSWLYYDMFSLDDELLNEKEQDPSVNLLYVRNEL